MAIDPELSQRLRKALADHLASPHAGDSRDLVVDPYLLWAAATRFEHVYVPHSGRLRVVLELDQAGESRGVPGLLLSLSAAGLPADWVTVPAAYHDEPPVVARGKPAATVITADIRPEFLLYLVAPGQPTATLPLPVRRIELSMLIVPLEHKRPFHEHVVDAEFQLNIETPPDVVVGIIDDGIAFANSRFSAANGEPRIVALWDQAGTCRGRRSSAFGYGTEVDVPRVLAQYRGAPGSRRDRDDEEGLYRALGYRQAMRRHAHGTQVLDLAAGFAAGPARAAAARAPIVAVQMYVPGGEVQDTSGKWMAASVLDGIHYICNRADELGGERGRPNVPVVIVLSIGNVAGPHDGSSSLERGMDEFIARRTSAGSPTHVVVAAGNHHLARCRARVELAQNGRETMRWRVPVDDATPSFLELWYSGKSEVEPSDAVSLDVRIVPPRGDPLTVAPGRHAAVNGCVAVHVPPDRAAGGVRGHVLVALAPTRLGFGDATTAAAGVWKIDLAAGANAPVDIDAWVQRDDTLVGYPRRGRQSFFDDRDYEPLGPHQHPARIDPQEPGGYVRRNNTVNGIGTGAQVMLVGGRRYSDASYATYSARTESGEPPFHAICEDSATCAGVLAAGTRSGSTGQFNGTSAAAAGLAGEIVDRYLSGETVDLSSPDALSSQFAEAAPGAGIEPDLSTAGRQSVRQHVRLRRVGHPRAVGRKDRVRRNHLRSG